MNISKDLKTVATVKTISSTDNNANASQNVLNTNQGVKTFISVQHKDEIKHTAIDTTILSSPKDTQVIIQNKESLLNEQINKTKVVNTNAVSIFNKQLTTDDQNYETFMNNEFIEFSNYFTNILETTNTKGGIEFQCQLQIPNDDPNNMTLYETFIKIPLIIKNIFNDNEFTMVDQHGLEADINFNDDVFTQKNFYKNNIETTKLFNKIL